MHAYSVQRVQHRQVDPDLQLIEGVDRLGAEARQRVLIAQPHEVNALPQIGAVSEVVRPGAVRVKQRHLQLGPTDRRLADGVDQRRAAVGLAAPDLRRPAPMQEILPMVEHPSTLLLHDRGIAFEGTADLEVLTFDDALGPRDLAADNRVIERRRLPRRHEARRHEGVDAVAHEQVVFEAYEEPRLPGVALSAGAASQLQIDAATLVAIRADDVEAAERDDGVVLHGARPAQPDIGPPPRHVGGDRDRTSRARPRHDARFRRVVLRVQHLAGHAGRPEPDGQPLRLFDRERPDEHRPPERMGEPDFVDDRLILRLPMREERVRLVDPNHGVVRRHDHHVEPVKLVELHGRRLGRPGHAAQDRVSTEKMLQRE